jgi:putative DNA primase/helicase
MRQAAKFPHRNELRSERKTIEQQIENIRKRRRGKDEPVEALQAEIRELEKKLPDIPVVPQLWSQDITPEHLGTVMAEQHGRLALLSSEGGMFEIFAGRYSKHSGPNIDLLLQSYDGSPARIGRSGRVVYLPRPVLTVAIAPQPEVVASFSKHPEFRSRGLVGRFLFAAPKSPLGQRKLETVPIPSAVARDFGNRITSLIELPENRDEFGRPDPEVLTLSVEASAIWRDFERTIEQRMRDDGDLAGCRDWASKLPGKVARLAAGFYAITYPWHERPPEIQPEQVEAAVKVVHVFASHALSVFGLMRIDQTIVEALEIAAWAKTEQLQRFSGRDAFLRFQRRFERVNNMRPALALLIEHGYLRRSHAEQAKKGEIFEVNPALLVGRRTTKA